MCRKFVAFSVVLLVLNTAGFAQPEQLPPVSNVDNSESESYQPVEGDIVYLKSGKELRGVTIAHENPLYIEIEFLPGEEPLKLPRTAVDRIEYAADRLSGRTEDGLGDVRLMPTVIPGEEVSAEFHRMLMSPMSEEPLVLENVDYLIILREFTAKFSIVVDVSKDLENLSPEERKFSRTIQAGQTFFNFLRMDLAQIAPNVRVILKYDKLVLQKREEMPPPPGDMPPPPGGMPPPPGGMPPPPAQ